MKKLTFTLIIVLISLFLLNCDNSTKSKTESQVVYLNFYHTDDSLEIILRLFNDPMTVYNSFTINNEKIQMTERYNSGSIYYYGTFSDNSFNNGIQNLDIELKTDIGMLTSNIEKPDSIIMEAIPDSIDYGEDIILSWAGDADYYYIYYFYDYITPGGDRYSDFPSFDYVTKNSITFSNEHFNYDGVIHHISIYPINGTNPEEDIQGNWTGNGGGFINYYGGLYRLEKPIIVGNGLNSELSKKIDNIEFEKKLKKTYLLRKYKENHNEKYNYLFSFNFYNDKSI